MLTGNRSRFNLSLQAQPESCCLGTYLVYMEEYISLSILLIIINWLPNVRLSNQYWILAALIRRQVCVIFGELRITS